LATAVSFSSALHCNATRFKAPSPKLTSLCCANAQLFGRTMVCRNLDVATVVSRSSNLNCVTMEGDEARKKGTLSGGWHDTGRSKMAAAKGLKVTIAYFPSESRVLACLPLQSRRLGPQGDDARCPRSLSAVVG